MNTIKTKIDIEQILQALSSRKGRLKHSLDFIRNVLQSVNDVGVNETSRQYSINKSVIKSWRVPEWNKDTMQKQRRKNPELDKLQKRERYKKNRDKCIAVNLKYQTKRYQNDPGFRLKCLLRSRIWRVLKDQNVQKSKHFNEYTGCTVQELKEYMEGKFVDGMNWDNYGLWHVDHVIPCSSFDLSKQEEQFKCFHYSNLQPLWAVDNLIKGDRIEV